MEIRRTLPADFDALLALLDEVAAERSWIATEPGFDHDRYRRNWQGWIYDSRFFMITARVHGTVAGNLAIYPDPHLGCELAMFVGKAYRGRGIGRSMMESAFTWAREHEIPAIHLQVFPHNERAIRLYRSMGFVEVERHLAVVKRQNGEVWDTILMRKNLR